MAISLTSLKRGKSNAPIRMVVAGPPGIGKTTFACSAPSPVVIRTEEGMEALIDAGVLAEDTPRFDKANTYEDVMAQLTAVCVEDHTFRTLVFDSLSAFEAMVWDKLCRDEGKDCIEKCSGGFGKAYTEVMKFWRDEFLKALEYLHNTKGMNIILLAHTNVKRFESPLDPPYDRYELRLRKEPSALFEQWADAVAFALPKTLTTGRTEGSGKLEKKINKALTQTNRILYLDNCPATVAKNRWGISEPIDFTWANFAATKEVK